MSNPVESAHTATLQVEGSGIAEIKVELFNGAGIKVLEQEAFGHTLELHATDGAGRPLTNGVYLWMVTVRGFDGSIIQSDVKKLVLLQ